MPDEHVNGSNRWLTYSGNNARSTQRVGHSRYQ